MNTSGRPSAFYHTCDIASIIIEATTTVVLFVQSVTVKSMVVAMKYNGLLYIDIHAGNRGV